MAEDIDNEEPKPPVVEVARPDIDPPKVDSLGRSMANKRGRKPGPQSNASASMAQGSQGATRQTRQTTLKGELKNRLPTAIAEMTDEHVGEAISGAFSAIGLLAGPHWRLFPQEKAQLGETFGPLARLYGPEELAKWITILMCIPVVATVTAPRIAIQTMIARKEMKKEEGRSALLQIKGMMAAESHLEFEHQAIESAEYLKSQIRAGMETAADLRVQQIHTEGVVNGKA